MALDFTKPGGPNLIDTAVEPAKLFAALPRAAKYQYLRNVQSEGWTVGFNAGPSATSCTR